MPNNKEILDNKGMQKGTYLIKISSFLHFLKYID